MSLNIGDALSTGAEKLTTPAGLQLGVAYVVLQLIAVVGSNSMVVPLIEQANTAPATTPTTAPALSLPIGLAGGAVLFVLAMVLNLVLTLVVLRTVAHSASELDSIPSGVADGLFKPALFLVIASIVQGIAVMAGFIALVIPGIFIAVSLIFTQVFIAVEDEGPFEALSSSWSLAKGNRFPLFGLGLVLVVISVLVSIPTTILSIFVPIAGNVLTYVVSGFASIFTSAVLVASFQQLNDDTPTATVQDDDGVDRLDDDDGFDYA